MLQVACLHKYFVATVIAYEPGCHEHGPRIQVRCERCETYTPTLSLWTGPTPAVGDRVRVVYELEAYGAQLVAHPWDAAYEERLQERIEQDRAERMGG